MFLVLAYPGCPGKEAVKLCLSLPRMTDPSYSLMVDALVTAIEKCASLIQRVDARLTVQAQQDVPLTKQMTTPQCSQSMTPGVCPRLKANWTTLTYTA